MCLNPKPFYCWVHESTICMMLYLSFMKMSKALQRSNMCEPSSIATCNLYNPCMPFWVTLFFFFCFFFFCRQPMEVVEEKAREKRKYEREFEVNFFLGLEICLKGNK